MVDQIVLIRPLNESDSFEELTLLLHKAYAIRLEEGFRFTATHQSVQTTRERCQEGLCLIAESEGRIIGTATIRPPYAEDDVNCYRTAWGFGQFGVLPEFRGQGIGHRLYQECERYALSQGATAVGLDTPETAFGLIAMYQAWGFEVVGKFDYLHTNYVSVVMEKRLPIYDR